VQQQGKDRNLRVFAVTHFLSGLTNSMTQAVWQPFVLSLGAPMSTLGLLESIGGPQGIVTAIIQPIGGWLSDRRGRKPFIVLGGLAGVLAVGFYVVAAATRDWRWLLGGIVLLGMTLIARPARDSLVAESASADRRGVAFSVLMAAWVAPGIFAPTLGGFIAERGGFAPVFIIRLIFEGLRVLLLVWFLRETLRGASEAVSWRELKGVMARMFWPPADLRGLYWAMAIDIFAWGMGASLLFGMLSESRGFTTVQLGIMASLFSATWAITQMPLGRLVDRYGSKPLLVLSQGLGLTLLAGWLWGNSFTAFALLHAYFGFTAAAWMPAQQAIFANSVPAQQRGEALGRLAAFRGLIGFPAPYIGGLLFDRFGFSAPITANLIVAAIALLALILLVKEPTPTDTELSSAV